MPTAFASEAGAIDNTIERPHAQMTVVTGEVPDIQSCIGNRMPAEETIHGRMGGDICPLKATIRELIS